MTWWPPWTPPSVPDRGRQEITVGILKTAATVAVATIRLLSSEARKLPKIVPCGEVNIC